MQVYNESDFVSYLNTKASLDDSSVKQSRLRVNKLFSWLSGRELTKQSLEEFFVVLRSQRLKNNSLNTYIFAFRHFKNYCLDRGFDSNFLDGFKSFKKNQPEIIIFTLEEIEKIISTHLSYGNRNGQDCSSLDFTYLTLTKFFAKTGCRPEEAFSLKAKYLDLSAGKVQFVNTKTDKNRTQYLFGELLDELKLLTENKSAEDFVFVNSLGLKIHPETYRGDLKRRARVGGVVNKRIFTYNFRHSYVTHQLEVGIPIQVVADLVGHEDIQTTYKNYMHLADQTRRKAAMRHPLVRQSIEPQEIIKQIKENIESFNLRNDNRFEWSINDLDDGLNIGIKVKSTQG